MYRLSFDNGFHVYFATEHLDKWKLGKDTGNLEWLSGGETITSL